MARNWVLKWMGVSVLVAGCLGSVAFPARADQPSDALVYAAQSDDIGRFRHLLEANPDWLNADGVAVGVATGGDKCFAYYTNLHPNFQVQGYVNGLWTTPLLLEMTNGNIPRMEILLKNGASADGLSNAIGSPVETAMGDLRGGLSFPQRPGEYEAGMAKARLLLTYGAHIGPSHVLPDVTRLSMDALKLFVYHGGDLGATDDDGNTALHYATPKLGTTGFSDSEARPFELVGSGSSAKLVPVSCVRVAQFLLAHGAKIDTQNNAGETPLFVAVAYGKAGGLASLNFATKDQAYFRTEILPLVKLLLKKGANPNTPNGTGQTPLMVASQMGFTDAAVLLVHYGATLNAQDKDGHTALDIAELYGHADIKAFLAKHGGKE